MSQTLNELAKKTWTIAEVKGWHEPQLHHREKVPRDVSAAERIALIHSEVTEMLEALRDNPDPAHYYIEVDGKPEGCPVELIDVIIRCFDFAVVYDIDLDNLFEAKCAYNTRREYRHGGRNL